MKTLKKYIVESVSTVRLKKCLNELKSAAKKSDYDSFIESLMSLVKDNGGDLFLRKSELGEIKFRRLSMAVTRPVLYIDDEGTEIRLVLRPSLFNGKDAKLTNIIGSGEKLMNNIIDQIEALIKYGTI